MQSTLPFFTLSRRVATRRFALWAKELPQVKPYYAVKCNPAAHLISWAAEAGWGFDCASPLEYETVRCSASTAADIIYANPCKSPHAIKHTQHTGIPTTFDSAEELDKLCRWKGHLILRLKVDDSGSKQPFGSKFGCPLDRVPAIMRELAIRSIKLGGVSFHVGSHSFGKGSYGAAIGCAHEVIERYSASFVHNPVIDIGGGFPGSESDNPLFEMQAKEIRESLICDRSYIAEPGRFLGCAPFTLYVPIIAKRRAGDGMQTYTVDESIYSSFSGVPFDGLRPVPFAPATEHEDAIVFGRTCDSQDVIMKGQLPMNLAVGDYLTFREMGAYTLASSSQFNGFPITPTHIVE